MGGQNIAGLTRDQEIDLIYGVTLVVDITILLYFYGPQHRNYEGDEVGRFVPEKVNLLN